MGEVLYLSDYQRPSAVKIKPRRRRRRVKRRPKKAAGPWRFADLQGRRPRGHSKIKYGPRGRVLMALDQVWVDGATQELWVVHDLVPVKHRKGSLYPNDVLLIAYRGTRFWKLAETTVRLTMRVWDQEAPAREELMQKLNYMSRHDPQSPWYGQKDAKRKAQKFFGLDARGNRND